MSRDKQIEEMAFNLIMATSPLGVKDLTKQFDYKTVATDLYELYGWCKASDVAREIFEEIFKLMNEVYASVQYGCYSYGTTKNLDSPSAIRQCGKLEGVKYLGDKIAELKKKYTEGER